MRSSDLMAMLNALTGTSKPPSGPTALTELWQDVCEQLSSVACKADGGLRTSHLLASLACPPDTEI